jgi:hypothetical protein
MYWPNGVPRVYAVNGPEIIPREEEDSGEDGAESDRQQRPDDGEGEATGHRHGTDSESGEAGRSEDPASWADEPITGLCVGRGGHLFATMTKSSLAIWQTKV